MANYNLFLKTATQGATPLGLKAGTSTLLEALLKGGTVEPTVPSTTTAVQSGTEGKGTFTLEVPALLKAELVAGAKITGLTVHLYAENGGASGTLKRFRFGVVSPSVTAEPEIPKGTPEWRSEVSLTKEQAEALNLAGLEALELLLQSISGKAWNAFELYVSLATEASEVVQLSGKVSVKAGTTGNTASAVAVHGSAAMAAAAHATSASHVAVHGSASLTAAAPATSTSHIVAHGSTSLIAATHATSTSQVAAHGAAHVTAMASATTASRVTVATQPRLTFGVTGAIAEHAGEAISIAGKALFAVTVKGAVAVRTTLARAVHVGFTASAGTASRVALSRAIHVSFASSAATASKATLSSSISVRFGAAASTASHTGLAGHIAVVFHVAGRVSEPSPHSATPAYSYAATVPAVYSYAAVEPAVYSYAAVTL